jgi:hypothetical protein
LFVGYESAGATYKSYISRGAINQCVSCNQAASYNFERYIYFRAASIGKTQSKINSNLRGESTTSGLSITYSLNCNPESFICSIKKILATALWYRAGAEIMSEMEYSKRLNSVISIYKQDHKELRNYYMAKYNAELFGGLDPDGMVGVSENYTYANKKGGILNRINLPNDICFLCEKKVQTQIRVP